MKNKMRYRITAAAAVFCLLTAAGCGGSSSNSTTADTAAAGAPAAVMDGGIYESAFMADEKQEMEEIAEQEAGTQPQEQAEATAQPDRKLIKSVDMSVETESFDRLLSNVEQRVKELGGYIEQSSVYNGSYTSDYRSRNAHITIRVPSDRLDEFVTELSEQSNVTNKSESTEDVTLKYVDLDSHKKALLAEQESLLSMLKEAETIEDIIKINEQLTDVRYQIESMESQLRTFDNLIDYSTVNLHVDEVEHYVPYSDKTAGERIRTGFVRNLHKVGDGIANFCIEFVILLPILLTTAVIIGAAVGFMFIIIKLSDRRAAKKKREALTKKNASEKQKEENQNGK